MNPTAQSGTLRIKTGCGMVEYGRLRKHPCGFFTRAIEVEVQPYDLLVFGRE